MNPPGQLYIDLYNINNTGIYPLKSTSGRYCEYHTLFPDEKDYNTKTSDVGEIVVTRFDLTNRIISGTFWFNAQNIKDPNDKVSVTDGRFDLPF
ncbi:MAG: hypothetical protein EOP43_03840 [Sphingobacteriaceae bacterium]|nr:MAG: hypothetical protein EOP43_03840 [Sphingobacteriaceae bacterium]